MNLQCAFENYPCAKYVHQGRIFCRPAGEPMQFLDTLHPSLCYSDNVQELAIQVNQYIIHLWVGPMLLLESVLPLFLILRVRNYWQCTIIGLFTLCFYSLQVQWYNGRRFLQNFSKFCLRVCRFIYSKVLKSSSEILQITYPKLLPKKKLPKSFSKFYLKFARNFLLFFRKVI